MDALTYTGYKFLIVLRNREKVYIYKVANISIQSIKCIFFTTLSLKILTITVLL